MKHSTSTTKYFTQTIKQLAAKVFQFYGLNRLLDQRLRERLCAEQRKSGIRVVFDIGAHKGDWAEELQSLMPEARIICFEANPRNAQSLQDKGFQHFMGILSNPGITECDFYIPEDSPSSTGASYYKEVSPAFESTIGVRLSARTLGEIVAAESLPQPDLIKIDTQGSEIDIISGGTDIFRNAKFVLMELPTVRYNIGAPNLGSYMATMGELGFLPVEVTEIHKSGGILIQLDFLFAHKSVLSKEDLAGINLEAA